ncbi:MAG: VanW family protein [Oscillospiraceae bacterium]
MTNVKLAAEKINGVILQPGQTFSYNDVLGQRTKANGFKEAGAYSGGQVVQEVGGGICQVSSTLYYCAMVSNLKINTRTCHYFPVAYIEPGMDATVSWGGPEFKFTNSREYPIEIKAYVEKNSITVEIWGTDVDGSYVKMSYTANGLRATTYRTVYDKDGNQISHTARGQQHLPLARHHAEADAHAQRHTHPDAHPHAEAAADTLSVHLRPR